MGEVEAELEHLASRNGGARGSRPIGIPRGGVGMASTFCPAAGRYMPGFVPPHELAAVSVNDADGMLVHSHRHKSTAERLRTAVFEQTGHMSVQTAAAFLHAAQPPNKLRRPL
ncbi:hypothetical protein HYH03_012021 [Edaphochlamys debaryana]|uniref:Uncharacterized protein n=1 Tax=Edaphochlamys debaryana TaxID=47281 RepID=A0A835XSR9_9CHLO|nr:hypothetical protein HYH03_012021 [Edaphochlamys debaryana]|eukprot:KAG2489573.1 hypothetical protein HYH03_012021 [Edaphochlamys debaryana]